jgi:hypothetical protein
MNDNQGYFVKDEKTKNISAYQLVHSLKYRIVAGG